MAARASIERRGVRRTERVLTGEEVRRESSRAELLDLVSSAGLGGSGAILSHESDDLDVNLVRFSDGLGVAAHRNQEVDVLIVAIAGEGVISVEQEEFTLGTGMALLIPKNTVRAIRSCEAGDFVYLSIHRRRAKLMPTRRH